ncbi:MAG: transposase [Candidatus Pacebacteria bacterium]|jgi:REP element-mobilizing transposase RayT|nr:transposase [Candidatus Paceibacterota bacterium]
MNNLKYKQSAQGAYYHLYNRGNQKKDIFLDEKDYEFYLRKMTEASKKYSFAIISYCLMPNHIHLIVRQDKEYPPAKFISSVHTSYAAVFNKKYKTVGHLFQDRFKQKIIENDDYMRNLIAYVHLNPVKAGICNFPKEYKWSSHMEYAKTGIIKDSDGLCDRGLIEEYGMKGETFEEFVTMAGNISKEDAFDD